MMIFFKILKRLSEEVCYVIIFILVILTLLSNPVMGGENGAENGGPSNMLEFNRTEGEAVCVFPPKKAEDPEFTEKKKLILWIAYRIIGPGVVGIGLVGNVLNLMVLTRPSLNGVTYTYLIGLACSDIGVLLCAIPMMIRQTGGDDWSWGLGFFYSYLEHPLANICMASSIFIVICLTIERFASVCLPTKFNSVHTAPICKKAILTSYLSAIAISIPLCLLKRLCQATPEVGDLEMEDSESQLSYRIMENFEVTSLALWKAYLIISEIIVRFGPATILAILNLMIIVRFCEITETRRKMRQGNGDMAGVYLRGTPITKKSYKEEKRLITLLSAIVLLFLVTTTPVAFLGIFYSETWDDHLYFQIFRAIANCLELCNFALNFYIYFLCSKEFRKNFLSFFTPFFKKSQLNFRSVAQEAPFSQAEAEVTKRNGEE